MKINDNSKTFINDVIIMMSDTSDTTSHFIMLYIDINGMSDINRLHGKLAGDKVLVNIECELNNFLSSAMALGSFSLHRIKNDEFCIFMQLDLQKEWCLISEKFETPSVSNVCSRICSLVKGSITNSKTIIDNFEIKYSISIGALIIDRYSLDLAELYNEFSELIKIASNTVRHASGSSINQVTILNSNEIHRKKKKNIAINTIKLAMMENRVLVHYQPVINTKNESLVNFEALVRIREPGGEKFIQPSDFIPYILNNELIVDLGMEVIKQVLVALDSWNSSNFSVRVAVNVTVRQIQDPFFASKILGMLLLFPSVHNSQLSIELIEAGDISDFPTVIKNIETLKNSKIFCCLDDFGTGSASFFHLRVLPVNRIKIDQSFVRGILINKNDEAIVKSCIGIAEAFQIDVVAEGVETADIARKLNVMGCYQMQGYLISKPMEFDRVLPWIVKLSDLNSKRNLL